MYTKLLILLLIKQIINVLLYYCCVIIIMLLYTVLFCVEEFDVFFFFFSFSCNSVCGLRCYYLFETVNNTNIVFMGCCDVTNIGGYTNRKVRI